MKRSIRLAVLVGVASAVPASPFVLAQVQKAAAPKQDTITIVLDRHAACSVQCGDDILKAVKKIEKAVEKPHTGRRPSMKPSSRRWSAAAKVDADGLDPMAAQFIQQFRSAMRAEYYFIRSVCAPTPEQRTRIAREGETALREASKAYAQAQMRPVQMRNGRWAYPDPRKMIEEAMAKSVKPLLTPDQAARYTAESETRAADRKKAAARNIVSKLDQELILTPDQRAKIDESVVSRWDDSWCQSLETLLYGDQYYPRLPDDVVTPYLDAKQKEIWHGARQNQNFFFGFVGNMLPNEDPAEDKELVEARMAADKDQPPLPQNAVNGRVMLAVPPAAVRAVAPAAVKAMPAKK